MVENSKIEWTHHTFNFVWGCSKVSPGCANCYAEAWDKRMGGDHWGVNKPRRIMSDKYWREPLKWNKKAEQAGERHRVFCSSMADVFDADSPTSEREKLWQLIKETPALDWLLLTKRPQNIRIMLPADWNDGYPNVWLGATAENQEMADKRINVLLGIPAVIHFLSCEPLLGPIDLQKAMFGISRDEELLGANALSHVDGLGYGIDWVIVGGESGHGARPMHPDWARGLRDQCVEHGVKYFFKQWGEFSDFYHVGNRWNTLSDDRRMNQQFLNGTTMIKLGKKETGRLLDDRTWDEFPSAK